MVATEKMIDIVRPAAPRILAIDGDAIAGLSRRRKLFAGVDQQPAAVALAAERRMLVATAMRAEIAPALGWELIEEHLDCGAYEWLVDGSVTVRLSKTTPESRRATAAKQILGVQPELEHFILPPPARSSLGEEAFLIRLNGDPLGQASVDVIAAGPKGPVGAAVSLRAIAEMEAEEIRPAASAPSKPKVSLPGALPARERG
jgi:hypothetical protein